MPLQMIEQTSMDINNALTTSHDLAKELRDIYDLHPVNIQKQPQEDSQRQLQVQHLSTDIITNLNGFLKDYANSEENPVDVIKFIRENIS